MEQPSYYAIIPANVRYDKDLTATAKLLYGEITTLCSKNGICWATNDYFSKLYNCSVKSISRNINSLVKKGYIQMALEQKYGSIQNRYIAIDKNVLFDRQKCLPYDGQKCPTTIDKNVQENNTSSNNTSINITPYNPPKGEIEGNQLFKIFWEEYPRHVSKGNAEKWFIKNNPSEKLVNKMISKLKLLKKTNQWLNNRGKFIPYPITWLNAKGWEDEIVEENMVLEADESAGELLSDEELKEFEKILRGEK